MQTVTDFAREVWTYKLSLAPVVVTYLLFDIPAIVRRLTRVAYVPMYFLFFPSGHSDRLYAQYFNEDDYYGVGSSMSDDEKRTLRWRIQATAIWSMVFATIVAPWLCGFISAFYLTPNQFIEFLCVLLVVKVGLIAWVLWRVRDESFAVKTGFYYVVALYTAYLFLVWRGLTKAYEWTHAHLESGGVFGLSVGLLDYAYVDLFVNIIVVSAATWAITTLFTDPSRISKA
jgi:hypothetical protein